MVFSFISHDLIQNLTICFAFFIKNTEYNLLIIFYLTSYTPSKCLTEHIIWEMQIEVHVQTL